MREYRVFSVSGGAQFSEKRGPRGAFCGGFSGGREKKFYFFVAAAQRVGALLEKKVKKNFGGLENVRIFAPAFERGRRPVGAAR